MEKILKNKWEIKASIEIWAIILFWAITKVVG